MSTRDNITYPFRLAAWHTSRFLSHPEEEKQSTNFVKGLGVTFLATTIAAIGGFNISPDDSFIEGQTERVAEYKEQIDSLNINQQTKIETLRDKWRLADTENKDALQTEISIAKNDFILEAFEILASIHTEDKIPETKAAELLDYVATEIAPIDTITMNTAHMFDIGDAASLNECQIEHAYSDDNEINRAWEISKCASDREADEIGAKIVVSPMLGVGGFLGYLALFAIYSATPLPEKLREHSKSDRPKRKKTNHY